jgi:hypothetical protein
MTYTTAHKKPPKTCYSKGLTTDTIGSNFYTMAHERKAFAGLAKLLTLGGFQVFPNLKIEIYPTVDNAAAAYYLNRQPQTLRICGNFAFSAAEIKPLLGV